MNTKAWHGPGKLESSCFHAFYTLRRGRWQVFRGDRSRQVRQPTFLGTLPRSGHTLSWSPTACSPSSHDTDWLFKLWKWLNLPAFLEIKAWRSTMTLVGLRRGIVTLPTWLLVNEVPTHFLQPLCVLHLLETHWWLCLWIESTQVQHIFIISL